MVKCWWFFSYLFLTLLKTRTIPFADKSQLESYCDHLDVPAGLRFRLCLSVIRSRCFDDYRSLGVKGTSSTAGKLDDVTSCATAPTTTSSAILYRWSGRLSVSTWHPIICLARVKSSFRARWTPRWDTTWRLKPISGRVVYGDESKTFHRIAIGIKVERCYV